MLTPSQVGCLAPHAPYILKRLPPWSAECSINKTISHCFFIFCSWNDRTITKICQKMTNDLSYWYLWAPIKCGVVSKEDLHVYKIVLPSVSLFKTLFTLRWLFYISGLSSLLPWMLACFNLWLAVWSKLLFIFFLKGHNYNISA